MVKRKTVMRKYIFILVSTLILFLFSGCRDAEELIPTAGNKLTALSFLTSDLIETSVTIDENAEVGEVIIIETDINGLKTTDMTKVRVMANIPNNAYIDPAFVEPVDLSKPYSFDVVGADGERQSYTIRSTLSAVYNHKSIWKKTASELNFTNHNNGAVGISGDYVVIHDRSGLFYLNVSNGIKAGDISMAGVDWDILPTKVPLHMATDDAGNIVASNFATAIGQEIHMFWWEGVTAKPKLLFKYVFDIVGGQIGRKIFVRGDMKRHAFLYMGISNKNIFLQWEIKDGKVVSELPRQVDYSIDYTMGIQPKIVPVELNANSNYFINRYEGTTSKVAITYMDGKTNLPIYKSEHHIQDVYHQWLGGGHAFDYVEMDGAFYIFLIEQNGNEWMREVFDIRKVMLRPDKIKSIMELIKVRTWNDWLNFPLDPKLASNGNVTGEVRSRVSEDGQSAIVVYLCTNGGVELWRIE